MDGVQVLPIMVTERIIIENAVVRFLFHVLLCAVVPKLLIHRRCGIQCERARRRAGEQQRCECGSGKTVSLFHIVPPHIGVTTIVQENSGICLSAVWCKLAGKNRHTVHAGA